MKRKYASILLVVLSLLLVTCRRQIDLNNLDETLQTPKGAVMAFFEAVKMGSDRATFRTIMSPRLKAHRDQVTSNQGNSYDDWIALWKRQSENIQSIGEPEPSHIDEEHIEVTRVPITILRNGETKQAFIKVAKYGNKWYWDEN